MRSSPNSRFVPCQLAVLGFVAVAIAACGTTKPEFTFHKPVDVVKKVVIAQYSVEWRNTITGHTVKMPLDAVHKVISDAPAVFADEIANNSIMKVVPFNGGVEGLSSRPCASGLIWPATPRPWVLWGEKAGESCDVSPEIVKALANSNGADAVLVVFSFWRLQVGFSKKVVVETTFKLYGKDGQLLASGKASGKESAGVFPAGAAAAESFGLATKRSFHDIAVGLGRGN